MDNTPTYDGRYDFWYNSPFVFNFDDLEISVKCIDEDAKINVNLLLYADGKLNELFEKKIKFILSSNNIQPEYVNLFIDWIDKDSIISHYGAEINDYIDTFSKVKPSNTEFKSIDEFKFIKNLANNFTDYFDDTTINLFNYLTIYGDNQYNINTVSAAVLDSFGFLDAVEINAILEFRNKYPITKIDGLTDLIPELKKNSFDLIDGYLKTKSDILNFQITVKSQTNLFIRLIWIYNKTEGRTLFQKIIL